MHLEHMHYGFHEKRNQSKYRVFRRLILSVFISTIGLIFRSHIRYNFVH